MKANFLWGTLMCGLFVLGLCGPYSKAAEEETSGQESKPVPPVVSTAKSESTTAAATQEVGWNFWFSLLEEYRLRRTSSSSESTGTEPVTDAESDHDLRGFFQTGLRDPSGRFGLQADLGLWWDLDGVPAALDQSALRSMVDYRQLWWDVFSLNADYRTDDFLKLIRAGRQVSEHGLPATFDGASLSIRAIQSRLELFAFGGRTVHFFETKSNVFEDWIGSAGVTIRPMPYLKLELDYRFLREEILTSLEDGKETINDHSYGMTIWWQNESWLFLKAYVRGLNDSVSHAGGTSKMIWDELGLGLDLGLEAQVVTLQEINESGDPYSLLLGESLPHLRWRVDIWKEFETSIGVYGIHGGWMGRNLFRGDQSPFNRNMGQVYLGLQAADVVIRGLWFQVTGEIHYTHTDWELDSDLLITAGGSLGFTNQWLKAEVGSYYQRYKYDYYRTAQEIDDVRTTYGQVAVNALDWLTIKARYEFESYDRSVHTVTLTLCQVY